MIILKGKEIKTDGDLYDLYEETGISLNQLERELHELIYEGTYCITRKCKNLMMLSKMPPCNYCIHNPILQDNYERS